MGILLLLIGVFGVVYLAAHLVGRACPALGNLLHSQKSWLSFFVFVLARWKLTGDLQGDTKGLPLGLFTVALGISFLDKKKRF
jgi:hypothetical protein